MTHQEEGPFHRVAPDNDGKLVFAANDALLRGFSMSMSSYSGSEMW